MGTKMHVSVCVCVLLAATCVLAADKQGNTNRRTKPFVADAVGNTLPPPSSVPATVGSPINLLTPDKYEFYTFDESGELVKRLMTLEEIQAIVAAGEDSEGLVTFANDNQPTIAFNFSQAPYTKVHSVVTNVQNVLKAQMEAHKNKPPVQPTLDTPDVSDTWSLILPSIFGNNGADIAPEKSVTSFTPETETLENWNKDDEENSLSKEGGAQISSSTTEEEDDDELKTTTTEIRTTASSTTTTTTTTTAKPTTTRKVTSKPKPSTTTTVRNKLLTTTRPRTTTTKVLPTTRNSISTTTKPITTTSVPKTTSTKLTTTTQKLTSTTTVAPTTKEYISNDIPTAKPIEFEKISTFIPVSTVKYVTERTSEKPIEFTKAPFVYAPTTKRSPSTTTKSSRPISSTEIPKLQTTAKPPAVTTTQAAKDSEFDRLNLTTVTTQSVSPTTTVSSTEFLTPAHTHHNFPNHGIKESDPVIPMFDVAQSISQIASDLGSNYQPIPTSSNLLDSTRISSVDMESKEDLDMDMPSDDQNKNKNEDNFVKISTIDPHPQEMGDENSKGSNKTPEVKVTTEAVASTESLEFSTTTSEGTTIDPILTGSMEDLLSQVVNEAPKPQLDSKTDENKDITTEKIIETTTSLATEVTTLDSLTKNVTVTQQEPENMIENQSIEKHDNVTAKAPSENEILLKVTSTEKSTSTAITTEKISTISTSKKEATTSTTTEKIISSSRATTLRPMVITTEKETQEKNITKIDSNIITNELSSGNKKNEGNGSKDFIKISASSNTNISINGENKKKVQNTESTEKHDMKTGSHKHQNNENKKETSTVSNSNSDKTTTPKAEATTKPFKFTSLKNKTTIVTPPIQNQIFTVDKISNNKTENVPDIPKAEEYSENTTTPKAEVTTKPFKFTSLKNKTTILTLPIENKISSVDKITNSNNNTEKVPDTPKVEEFKKKIQKVNDEEMSNDRNEPWKLIPTVTPTKGNDLSKEKIKPDAYEDHKNLLLEFSKENQGLEVTTKDLGEDIAQFTELCNELAFRYWNKILEKTDKKRSFVLSPYSITSMLAMMFMGAKGATSGEMNEILKLDDMVTFNPHFTLKNISDSIDQATNSGIAVSAFVRELFSDRNKGKILTFYKERAQHFYSGHVEEINFKLISDIIRRRTNLLVKKHTWGKVVEFMKTNNIAMQPPLAAFSANIFQTDCTGTSVEGRDGEMYFVVSPNVRQRRLVPVPAVVYKSGFLAGYDPALDATAAALGSTNSIVSTIFLMPGQQGNIVHADDLEKLETRLLEAEPSTPVWSRILRSLLPRVGLELQIPRFAHKSVFNVSSTLREMGLKELFDAEHADLGGLNGPSKDLYLSDMIQLTSFVTCGEGFVDEQHHIEEYPEIVSVARRRTSRWADWDEPRDYQRAFHDPHDLGEAMNLPLHLRPRQARVPTRSVQPARLKFDRPFLFFVRHNPSGMILYVGRYNPRLLP